MSGIEEAVYWLYIARLLQLPPALCSMIYRGE